MPINIPSTLPAAKILESENIFVMYEERAMSQDIRPLRVLILNLMPKKIETETQLLRVIGNTPIQVDIELLQVSTHQSKNTPAEHLLKFYKTFDQVQDQKFDAMIITGAPIEQIPFEAVDYWPELCQIMAWSKSHVYSTLHICWGAQAGLYFHYGIPKYQLPEKMFGIFPHYVLDPRHVLVRGFDELFYVPHSRHTGIHPEDIDAVPELTTLVSSPIAGPHIVATPGCRQIFVTGHWEYDRDTLANEYFRDRDQGLSIQLPYHYFPDNDPSRSPIFRWRSHANLFFSNWLNYVVYEDTPFNLEHLKDHGA